MVRELKLILIVLSKIVIGDGKEISTRNVTLENDFGNLELVNLFYYSHQQILFTKVVGAHGVNAFLYKLKIKSLFCYVRTKAEAREKVVISLGMAPVSLPKI
jgi:hypothetical protein